MKIMLMNKLCFILIALFVFSGCSSSDASDETEDAGAPDLRLDYPWLEDLPDEGQMLVNAVPAPAGTERVQLEPVEWGYWLRHLPLRPAGSKILLHNGTLKDDQAAHAAIFNMDVGQNDLQQCADAIIRLRAEYLRRYQGPDAVHFNFTTGECAYYSKWIEGYRPEVGKSVRWVKKEDYNDSYRSFRYYLQIVFNYAGTVSLEKEMKAVRPDNLQPGDVFVRGGYPGHAALVLDVAVRDKKKIFLLGQAATPAQDFHLLNNPCDSLLSPWFELDPSSCRLVIPEYDFNWNELKRFED